jgi:hypothetical protein
MTSDHEIKNEDEEMEEPEAEASIDESMLDEISDVAAIPDETEGFGHIKDEPEKEMEKDDATEDGEDAALEEDAEDVDYDSFDDEDHL